MNALPSVPRTHLAVGPKRYSSSLKARHGLPHRGGSRVARVGSFSQHSHIARNPVITLAIVHDYIAEGTESESNRAHRLTLMREVCRFLRLD